MPLVGISSVFNLVMSDVYVTSNTPKLQEGTCGLCCCFRGFFLTSPVLIMASRPDDEQRHG